LNINIGEKNQSFSSIKQPSTFNRDDQKHPGKIEAVMYQIPQILEAAVIGVPHENRGEELAAVVVLKEGVVIDPTAIRDYEEISIDGD
jgi:non-ribosomal peptide synthetase component E (peptide arylation enzyme)